MSPPLPPEQTVHMYPPNERCIFGFGVKHVRPLVPRLRGFISFREDLYKQPPGHFKVKQSFRHTKHIKNIMLIYSLNIMEIGSRRSPMFDPRLFGSLPTLQYCLEPYQGFIGPVVERVFTLSGRTHQLLSIGTLQYFSI